MSQMKEQNITSKKELNKMEKSNLQDAEFKILLIRKLKELSEDLNSVKKNQSEMKEILTEMKNDLQGINSGVGETGNKSTVLNTRKQKHLIRTKREKIFKNEDDVRGLWDNFKHANIHILGVLEGEEREHEMENQFEK